MSAFRLNRLFSFFRKPKPSVPDLSAFSALCTRFEARWLEWRALPSLGSLPRGHVALLITPWVQSAVPMFGIEMAFMLRWAGCQVTLLFDDANFPFNSNDRTAEETRILRLMLDHLGDEFPSLKVTEQKPVLQPKCDASVIRQLLWENFIWLWKKEAEVTAYLAKNPDIFHLAESHSARIVSSLQQVKPDWVFLPGGVFGLSGLYVEACRKVGVDFTTYDSGPALLAACHQDVTGFHTDVAVAIRRLDEECSLGFLDALGTRGRAALVDKVAGNDPQKMQINPPDATAVPECDLLVCLNRRADTAAMMRLRIFDSVRDWLESVVRWFVQRGQGRLVIRQHPIERWEQFRLHDDYAGWVRSIDPEERFVTFVPADAPVNTYALIEKAKVVLPFTSRTGIEATILGKPIVLSTHSFYADKGFGWSASNRDDYFATIERGLGGGCPVTESHMQRAGLVNFIFANCEWLKTPLTARPEDFENWVKILPAELWSSEVLQDFKESLITRTPVPYTRFQRLYGDTEAARVSPSL